MKRESIGTMVSAVVICTVLPFACVRVAEAVNQRLSRRVRTALMRFTRLPEMPVNGEALLGAP